MNCVRCGLNAGHNRAVVELVSGIEIGGFCRSCELTAFGETLERGHWDGDGCALCSRDGHFALPVWESAPTVEDRLVVSSVEYDVTDETPVLCDEHLQEMAGDLGRDRESRARSRSRR
jgi:hypothetical protein